MNTIFTRNLRWTELRLSDFCWGKGRRSAQRSKASRVDRALVLCPRLPKCASAPGKFAVRSFRALCLARCCCDVMEDMILSRQPHLSRERTPGSASRILSGPIRFCVFRCPLIGGYSRAQIVRTGTALRLWILDDVVSAREMRLVTSSDIECHTHESEDGVCRLTGRTALPLAYGL
jgi:hypothetical protein